MNKSDDLRGVLVPTLTPFDSEGQPDPAALARHCDWLLEQGADGLAVFGTTSEANSLTLLERMRLLESLAEHGIAADQIMPGTGMCAPGDTVTLTRHALEVGCSRVLMLPPFYYKGVSDTGLFDAFSRVIDGVADDRLKIYLYHIPPMSQVALSPDLISRLIDSYSSTVVGLKDSGGDWEFTRSLLENFPGLSVFPGAETFLLKGLRHGASGCITASGNVNPAGIRRVFSEWESNDADTLQDQITRIRTVLQAFPMIPALKAMAAEHYGDGSWVHVRPPLVALDSASITSLRDALDEIGFSMARNGELLAA